MHQKVLSMILVLVMLLGLLSVSAFTVKDTTSSDSADSTEFMRIFHLDCGRKYFSVSEIESLIDTASENNYTHVELAIGNDGLRFLLDDMSVTANGKTYISADVKNGILSGNTNYTRGSAGELSQEDMDTIFSYAKEKNISIIPLLNSPGHMDAIIDCMESLGMSKVAFSASRYGTSARTIDLNNTQAVAFTQALVKKYVEYFAGKGCEYFNMGADEYANDKLGKYTGSGGAGFGYLIDKGNYSKFVTYVNNMATIIKNANMKPIAFNDGIYYNNNTTSGTFDKDIIVSYWTSGYPNYTPASASSLAKDHKIINTSDAWYYVLGDANSSYTYNHAKSGVSGTAVTDVPGDNDPTPMGCMLAFWCDEPSADYSTKEQSNVKSLIQTLAANNLTYFTKSTPSNPDSGTTEDGVIEVEVPVGSDWTKTIKNVDLSGQVGDYDQNVAKVTVSYDKQDGGVTVSPVTSVSSGTAYYIQSSDGKYLGKDANWVADSASAAQWTCTDAGYSGYYYLTNGSSYLYYSYGSFRTTTSRQDASDFTFDNGSFTTYIYIYIVPLGSPVTITKSDPVNASTITITGLTAGQETTVKIGDVTYHITVTDKAPSNAKIDDTLTLEYWITNYEVYETQSKTGHTKTITTSTDGATADEGIAITDIAQDHAYSFFDGTKDVYYWQAMRLDADNLQTNASNDDETADGTTLTHIRYHGSAWQYKTTDGVWHYFVSTDQLVAYYLQKTEVTQEIDTYSKDWGYATSGKTPDTSSNKGQVALTVAVVYPDGTVSPAEENMYANSTTIFNYWSNRDIGIIAPKNNSDYNIAKITVTDGTRDSNSSSNVWYTYDTITWDKTTDSATGKTWYNETEVWNKSSGTTPMVNGKNSNITWAAKNTAKLVLIYLETVERETNLNVVYWDDNAGVKITGSQIAMKFTQGDTEPSFKTDLKGVTAGVTSWPSKDKSSSDYLPDTAYVTNSSGVAQTFNKDLVTVPGVTGVYTSGLYEYVSADISDDGKTLTLHYNLRQVEGKTYVLDFGLPIEIPITDFFAFENDSLKNSVTDISFESSTSVTEKQGEYGKGKIDKSTGIVTYTLTKALDSKVAIPVFVTLNDAVKTVKRLQVYVIPATSVYYEDSFATFTNANGTKNVAQVDNGGKGIWTKVTDGTAQTDVKQALEALGSKENVYGYDKAYANSSKFSMGSATKVTVDANTATDNGQWPTATFTFRGTGFDVISLTNNKSGAISVKVYAVNSDGTETQVKGTLVNNYYGYELKDGAWTVNKNANNALYQIPVIKIDDLTYGTYKVVITAAYATYADKTGVNQYSFWLDAIRVYDPMVKDKDNYAQDGEGYPQYIKLHDALVNSTAQSQAFFIDGGSVANVETYKNFGPNNEVYLAEGQAITFKVQENTDIASIQIGAKAPSGTAAQMDVTGGTDLKQPLNTATEMYYKIGTAGGSFTITNKGKGLLSLTNLKITFKNKPASAAALIPPTAEEQKAAVMCVRALFAEPEQTFEPEHFTAKWSRNVHKGGKATLTVKTSADVEAIHVDDVTIDSYKVRTERSGWGSSAKKVTYHVFTYTVTATATADYTVCAINADGVMSDPITATLTVRPSIRDWWHNVFGKWQH